MHIAYFDESGDDGFPSYSSPLFALSASYLHYLNWKPAFDQILEFRRQLKKDVGLPVKLEIHAKYFLLNKNPYRQFGFTDADRIRVISAFCDLIASLELKYVNAVIVKPRILMKDYNVLDWALKMSIQRIENDLDPGRNPTARFLMITDEGRVGKMRATARRMQRVNFIPSKFGAGTYRREIQSLLEDPLPKDSRDSYFIQMCDLVAFVVYLHCLTATGVAGFSNRLAALISPAQVTAWMEQLKPRLNLLASGANPYGIVVHPGK
jgi:uncharacterized protein DUF3800